MAYPANDTIAFEALAVAGTAVGFTAGTVANALLAVARVEGAQVRYRTDGEDPTASVGIVANDGDVITVTGYRDIKSIRFIRTGSSATVNAEFIN